MARLSQRKYSMFGFSRQSHFIQLILYKEGNSTSPVFPFFFPPPLFLSSSFPSFPHSPSLLLSDTDNWSWSLGTLGLVIQGTGKMPPPRLAPGWTTCNNCDICPHIQGLASQLWVQSSMEALAIDGTRQETYMTIQKTKISIYKGGRREVRGLLYFRIRLEPEESSLSQFSGLCFCFHKKLPFFPTVILVPTFSSTLW